MLLARHVVYLVVRREGRSLTYLSLLEEKGGWSLGPLAVIHNVQDFPLDPVWELVKRPWSF